MLESRRKIKHSQASFKENRAERHSESLASLALMDFLISSTGCSAEVIVLIPCHGCAAFSSLFLLCFILSPSRGCCPSRELLALLYCCFSLMTGLSSLSASAACNRRLMSGRGMQCVFIDHKIRSYIAKHDRNTATVCQSRKNAEV